MQHGKRCWYDICREGLHPLTLISPEWRWWVSHRQSTLRSSPSWRRGDDPGRGHPCRIQSTALRHRPLSLAVGPYWPSVCKRTLPSLQMEKALKKNASLVSKSQQTIAKLGNVSILFSTLKNFLLWEFHYNLSDRIIQPNLSNIVGGRLCIGLEIVITSTRWAQWRVLKKTKGIVQIWLYP